MRELIAASLKYHGRRYVATVLAVLIAVAFVAASLVFGGALNKSIKNEVAGDYNGASAVLQFTPEADWDVDSISEATAVVSEVPGVAETYDVAWDSLELDSVDPNHAWISASLLGGKYLGQTTLTAGEYPTAPLEALLTEDAAKRLELGIGDTLNVTAYNLDEGTEEVRTLTITGLSSGEQQSTLVASGAELLITKDTLDLLSPYLIPHGVLVATGPEVGSRAQQQALVETLNDALKNAGIEDVEAVTAYEKVDDALEMVNTSQGTLTVMLLTFPIIAATVAMIVVGTTFQVIFRQREREMALLRVIGATASQVRWLMRAESFTVGLVGALLGLLLGILGGAGIASALKVLPTYGEALSSVSWSQAVIVLVIAVLLTMAAGSRPARHASSVSPVTALAGQVETVQQMSRKQKVSGAVAGVLTLGLGGFTWFLAVSAPSDDQGGRFLIVLGLAILTAGAVLWLLASVLPLITRAGGVLGTSASWRLAAANTARNPGRTAATGIAVFIGVTLISMVTVGAESLRATSTHALDASSPIDLVVTSPEDGFSDAQLNGLENVEGVSASAVLAGANATATVLQESDSWEIPGYALITSGSDKAVRGQAPNPGPGEVIVPYTDPDGQPFNVKLCIQETCQELVGASMSSATGMDQFMISEATAKDFAGIEWVPTQVWLKLENPDSYQTVVADIQDLGSNLQIDGSVAIRAAVEKSVDILVMVIVALLAVSVLVALVGITNTLSLSVAERVRENGLLRALGMTKRQVSNMLKWESLLIGVTSAVLGLVAGAFFGIVGFSALPMWGMKMVVSIPWFQWLLIAAVAILASLLASIIPGRAASRVSPVEALAHD